MSSTAQAYPLALSSCASSALHHGETKCSSFTPLVTTASSPNKNELRPQDVMRMLVHYHAYGDAEKLSALVAQHSQRILTQISQREQEEVERLEAEYQEHDRETRQPRSGLSACTNRA